MSIENDHIVPMPSAQPQNGIRYLPDGSAVVEEPYHSPMPITPQKKENLAFSLDATELRKIGSSLKEAIENDQESQKDFFSSVSDLLKILGINAIKIANSGLSNTGAPGSAARNINSSALFETWLDLTATIMSSIFPNRNPVSCQIVGQATPDLEDAALRKAAFFNAWLQYGDKGFDRELRRIVAWSILTGSIYCKVYVDSVLRRPTMRMIQPDKFIVNRDLSSHLSAIRKTQVHEMSAKEYMIRKKNGEFRDVSIQPSDGMENSPIQEALADISASVLSQSEEIENKTYKLFECHIETVIHGDKKVRHIETPLPYVVILDADSGEVLRITRNWDMQDDTHTRKETFVNFSFLPSLDGEGYGLVQTSAASAQTSSEILRELILAGSYASMPSGFVSALGQKKNMNLSPEPGKFVNIESNFPVGQAVAPLPFKEPSQVLFELKNQLEDSVRKPSAIINHKIADMSPQAPMGSTLAMMESLQKIPNFVLQGYHQSFGEVLNLLNECFFHWLPPQYPYPFKVPGSDTVMMKEDFSPHLQVVPGSDPTLQNSAYRLMRAELILSNALKAPQIHNLREVEKLFYKNLQIPEEDIAKILSPDPAQVEPPPALDPITENSKLLVQQPVKAYIAQDHGAHIVVHKTLMQNPDVSQNGAMMGAIQAHIYEHMALQQQQQLESMSNINLPQDPSQLPVEAQNQIAQATAEALSQMQQEQTQNAAPDPAVLNAQAAMIVAEAEKEMVQVKSREAELEAQIQAEKLDIERRKLDLRALELDQEQLNQQKKLALDEAVARGKDAREAAKTDLDLTKGKADLLSRSIDLTKNQN